MWSTYSNVPLFSSLSAVFAVLIMEATVLSLSAPVLLGQAELQLPLADGKAERGVLLVTVWWWDRLPPHSPPRREAAPARRGATNGVAATAKPSAVPLRPDAAPSPPATPRAENGSAARGDLEQRRLQISLLRDSSCLIFKSGEFEERLRRSFGVADADGDGKLSRRELSAALSAVGLRS